ncbi:unnamed protein product [Penicillium glandicola]
MERSIRSLPIELWDQICQSLELQDLCALRQSCRALTVVTDRYFASYIFNEFYLVLTSDGLRELRYLADHKVFSKHVKKLWIVPSLFCANYTWTLDDFKRVVKSKKHMRSRTKPALIKNRHTLAPDIAIEDRYVIYKDAVRDHFQILLSSTDGTSSTKIPFQDALESCLPSFSNLCVAGLRNYYGHWKSKKIPRRTIGIAKLQRQLGFNPIYPEPPSNITSEQVRSSCSRGSLFQSYVFSTLMAALGTTQTRIETLETSGGMMVDDSLSLTLAEEQAFTPVLQQLQHLSVRILSAHTQDSERNQLCKDEEEVRFLLSPRKKSRLLTLFLPRSWKRKKNHPERATGGLFSLLLPRSWKRRNNRHKGEKNGLLPLLLPRSVSRKERKNHPERGRHRLLPLLAQAASSIESLELSMRLANSNHPSLCQHTSGLDLADAHFDWVARHFRFSRLSSLSLYHVVTTVPSFKKFLETALHTLKILTLGSITWTSDLTIDPMISPYQRREHQDEGLRTCQEVCAYLRDHSLLNRLKITMWSYQRERIMLIDPVYEGRQSRSSFRPGTVLYDAKWEEIDFPEWIDQLRFSIR